MVNATERFEEFKTRIKEMDITPDLIEYQTLGTGDDERITVKISCQPKAHIMNFYLQCHAVMGMIAHFINRGWATDWSYTFIMKSVHTVTFIKAK